MRVLNIVNQLGLGGIETGLLQSIPYWKSEGIDVDICCLGPESLLDEDVSNLGCRILRISKTANCFKTARDLGRLLDHEDYSLVHSRFGYTSGGFALAASRRRIPCVVSIHSSEPLSLYSWRGKPVLSVFRRLWLTWNRRLMDKYVDLYVGHSTANLMAFEPRWQSHPSRYRLILNGISLPSESKVRKKSNRESLNLTQQAPVLLHVGSFKKEKNHYGLLQIFSKVLRTYPSALLVLVGDGLLRNEITTEAARLGLLKQVRFEGFQKNVWQYYDAADLLLFPSLTEGFGKVLAESAASRLPIVASDIPAHRESVATPQHRFLFPVPEYEKAARLAVEQLEASRAGKNDWVATCASHAQECFSMERFAMSIRTTYEEFALKAA